MHNLRDNNANVYTLGQFSDNFSKLSICIILLRTNQSLVCMIVMFMMLFFVFCPPICSTAYSPLIMNLVNVDRLSNYFTVVFIKSMHVHLSIQKNCCCR